MVGASLEVSGFLEEERSVICVEGLGAGEEWGRRTIAHGGT